MNCKKIPTLMVNGKKVKSERSFKYLGDIINNKGTNCDLVEDRMKKGDGCTASILSTVQQVTFGVYTMEATLLLYESIFLGSVLCNAQSWSNLNTTEMNKLIGCQLSFLKRILHAPKSSPTAVVYGELGILPIQYEIYSRQLMFLQHISKLDPDDPVRQVYGEQIKYTHERNWANEVEEIKKKMCIEYDQEDISEMSKDQWKRKVKKCINENAVQEINRMSSKLSKVKRQYSESKAKDYHLKLSIEDARTAFSYRSGTYDLKCQKTYKYTDLQCRACGDHEETVDHIVNQCKTIERDGEVHDVESDDVDTIRAIVQRLKAFTNQYNHTD